MRSSWRWPAAGSYLLLFAFASGTPAAGTPVSEEPPILSADLLLPRRLREGPHHRVAEVVANDGYLNTYTIESEFGILTAHGDDLLRVRVEEIEALAALREITRSEAFARSAAAAARRPFETAVDVVTRPGDTLKRLPSGVGRYVQRTVRKIRRAASKVDEVLDEQRRDSEAGDEPPPSEGSPDGKETALGRTGEAAARATRHWLGVDRSMREWARQLGVDPYTTNEILRHELERVAAAGAVGGFTVRRVTPGLGMIEDLSEVNQLVWTLSAADLELLNARRLKTLGLERDGVEALLANPAWSPSRLTGLVAALDGIPGVRDRDALARLAIAAGSEEEAFFFQRSAEMLRLYHRRVARVRRIVVTELWAGAATAESSVVLPLALDYLAWTEDAAAALGDTAGRFRDRTGAGRCELWLTGRLSPRARRELEELRCTVEERVRERTASLPGS